MKTLTKIGMTILTLALLLVFGEPPLAQAQSGDRNSCEEFHVIGPGPRLENFHVYSDGLVVKVRVDNKLRSFGISLNHPAFDAVYATVLMVAKNKNEFELYGNGSIDGKFCYIQAIPLDQQVVSGQLPAPVMR